MVPIKWREREPTIITASSLLAKYLLKIHCQMYLTTTLLDENNFIQYFSIYHLAQRVSFYFQKDKWVLRKLSAIYVLRIPQGLVHRAVYHILLGLA